MVCDERLLMVWLDEANDGPHDVPHHFQDEPG